MSRAELVECRINLLKQMDEYICDAIGDEEIWEIWIAVGVPDEARDEDYAFIAEDDEMWKGVCVAFGHLAAGYIEQGDKTPYFFGGASAGVPSVRAPQHYTTPEPHLSIANFCFLCQNSVIPKLCKLHKKLFKFCA